MVTLYSTHCPKCKVLETKLQQAQITYSVIEDISEMEKLNINTVPVLKVDNNYLSFADAVKWVNKEGNLI